MPPVRHPLPDGRWHFQHGPIDLIIGASGDAAAVRAAHDAAWARFAGVLQALVAELPLLRQPVAEGCLPQGEPAGACPLRGQVARSMWAACHPHRHGFITPMAAVAGAVAEHIAAVYQRAGVDRAWVNNGGDIALHLAPGHALRVGLFGDLSRWQPQHVRQLPLDGRFQVTAGSPVRGIATSGWRGRSVSLGIADSVTVLAATAAQADAAATVIANAVTVDDARIVRRPAHSVKDDSDLGSIPVTVQVPPLPAAVVERALHSGARRARELRACGLVHAVVLLCQGRMIAVPQTGALPPAAQAGSLHFGSVFASRRWSDCHMKPA